METSTKGSSSLLILLFCLFSALRISSAADTISTTQFLKDGETIVSSGGTVEMGFFSPGSSKNRYVGVWYTKTSNKTVVWVANRKAPLNDTSGVLKVIPPGLLVLQNGTNDIVWSSNTSRSVPNPIAKLLDNGNIVVRDANDDNPDNYLWQGFDYPSDTLLPTMKLGRNFVTGIEMYLSSWTSYDDPAPGPFSYHCDPTGYPQDVLREGSELKYRAGPWNGLRWSGAPNMVNNSFTTFGLVYNEKEVYYSYDLANKSVLSIFTLTPAGDAERFIWNDRTQAWILYHAAAMDSCDTYKLCGAYGSCNIGSSPVCGCLDKFEPKRQDDWNTADWSSGCVRKTPLNCSNGDGFLKYSGIKLPDTRNSWFNVTMTREECRAMCLKNCSCTAYTDLDISKGGSGCLLWLGDLLDIRSLPEGGQDIFIRMAASEVVSQPRRTRKNREIFTVVLPLSLAMVLLGLTVMLYVLKRKRDQQIKRKGASRQNHERDYSDEYHNEDFDVPLFDLPTITKATGNFSVDRKLGEGGFGPVYKGVLEDGKEIAVKRLSTTSTQGLDEFKNEVNCIAKLQHRNLVKLLGCCIQEGEKMLIYEYMPNRSLNSFIFDSAKGKLLDWPKRFNIINGIARGLQYLHIDSRLRIIHRDLKASNILLDIDMNPKISDFGLARSFGGNETGSNTRRVVGTYGYMSPEYQVDGLFSVKSDVFSFGVLVLEIVSGKKNRGFSHPGHNLNLLGHAWQLYKEGNPLELADEYLVESCYLSEVLRSIHVGLLCVQQSPEDRPTMASVVLMLGNDGALPPAKQPGFYTERHTFDAEYTSSTCAASSSVNEVTITLLDAR